MLIVYSTYILTSLQKVQFSPDYYSESGCKYMFQTISDSLNNLNKSMQHFRNIKSGRYPIDISPQQGVPALQLKRFFQTKYISQQLVCHFDHQWMLFVRCSFTARKGLNILIY